MDEPSAVLDRLTVPLRALMVAGAVATALIALWLGFVVTAVLPARDPGHVPMWAAIAVAFLGYALVTLVLALRGAKPGALAWLVVALSLAAVVFGVGTLASMLRADEAHFEGYLLVIGAVLAAHGLAALGYAVLGSFAARKPRALGAS